MDQVVSDSADRKRLLARLAELRPAIEARAGECDAKAVFPADDMAALWGAGLLAAVLPQRVGGLGVGTEPCGAETLMHALRCLGAGNLAVGRLFEAHVNALRLVTRLGTPAQLTRVAAAVRAGAMFGLWVTDPPENALRAAADGRLQGGKAFCSGAGHLSHAVVALRDPADAVRLAIVPLDGAVATPLPVQLQGMRAATTGQVRFDGLRLDPDDWLGGADAYMEEPDFSAGAWRTCAVTCGGLEALLGLAVSHLVARGRDGDPHQRARVGRAWIAQQTALQWLSRAADAAELGAETGDAIATVGFARTAIEDACLDVIQMVERSIGLPAFLHPSPIERVRRDLAVYLRQPAGDEVLVEAAAHIMRTRFFA